MAEHIVVNNKTVFISDVDYVKIRVLRGLCFETDKLIKV